MQAALPNRRTILPGGCKLLLVFEFLITSEYKIPTNTFPRLPLWSTTMLRSFIALDTMPGETLHFGRLQMKHISATPFRDSLNETALQLPESILHHINNNLPSIHNIQDKIKLQCTSQKFWQTIVKNSIPTLESYLDDALSLFKSTITSTEIQKLAPSTVQVFTPIQLDVVQTKPAETNSILRKNPLKKYPDLQSILKSHDFLDFPGPHIYPPSFYPECSQAGIDSIIQNFSKSLFITDSTKFDPLLTVGTPTKEYSKSTKFGLTRKLTISLSPSCRMNPHSLDCYSKMLNTDQLIHGRQGLIPNADVIKHTVQREDMELLLRPLLNHSDPICRDMLSEQRVGFSLQIANFVHLPCFVDKQWMVITANLKSGRFFDTMNPDASGKDKFTSIISTIYYNFKSLFVLTYPNCTAFSIKDFDYRFLAVPRTHFRLTCKLCVRYSCMRLQHIATVRFNYQ